MSASIKHKNAPTDFSWNVLKKIWSVLPAAKKRVAIKLWLLMIGGMAFEMLSVGLVIPVITLLTKPELITGFPFVSRVLPDSITHASQQALVLISMAALFAVYLCKTSYLAFLAWHQSRFIYGVQGELAHELFAIYLRQPYTFHLQRNSAHLIRNVQGEVSILISSAINPCMLLLAESLVVLGLFGLLLYIEPFGTMTVFGILIISGLAFQWLTKQRISYWGRHRQFHEGYRIKHLNQGLGGVKDVKLLGREADFLRQYSLHTAQSMKMNQRQYFMQQMPRLWLELLAIVGLCVLMTVFVMQGRSIIELLPTLALFAAVCFRLMPSANRIISALQQMRFGLSSVELLHAELDLPKSEKPKASTAFILPLQNEITLENISYIYPVAKKPALQSIAFTIKKGDMVGFVGESGSGKSTLVDIILGLLPPTQGKILVDGSDINENLRCWQDQIGYVPQSIFLTDDTIRRNIAFGLADDEISDDAIYNAIKSAQLEKFVSGLAEGANTIVGERGVRLSGGQKQRIGIARALYHNPEILVLDEATSALDAETESQVMSSIYSLQGIKTILIVAHRLSTLSGCKQLYVVENGVLNMTNIQEQLRKNDVN